MRDLTKYELRTLISNEIVTLEKYQNSISSIKIRCEIILKYIKEYEKLEESDI